MSDQTLFKKVRQRGCQYVLYERSLPEPSMSRRMYSSGLSSNSSSSAAVTHKSQYMNVWNASCLSLRIDCHKWNKTRWVFTLTLVLPSDAVSSKWRHKKWGRMHALMIAYKFWQKSLNNIPPYAVKIPNLHKPPFYLINLLTKRLKWCPMSRLMQKNM